MLVLIGAAVAWRMSADAQEEAGARERVRAAAQARSRAQALSAVVVAARDAEVDVVIFGRTYTLAWTHGPLPRAGATLELRGARLTSTPAGFRVVVEEW